MKRSGDKLPKLCILCLAAADGADHHILDRAQHVDGFQPKTSYEHERRKIGREYLMKLVANAHQNVVCGPRFRSVVI